MYFFSFLLKVNCVQMFSGFLEAKSLMNVLKQEGEEFYSHCRI